MQDSCFPTFEVINMHNTKTLGFSFGERDAVAVELAEARRELGVANEELAALRRDKEVLMTVIMAKG